MINFELFIFKKVLFFFSIISILILCFCDNKLISLLAFASGVVVGIIKLFLVGNLTNVLLLYKTKKMLMSIVITLALILIYGVIFCSIIIGDTLGVKFFVLFMAGVIQVNLAVFTNCLLELAGLTKNNLD